MHVYEYCMHFSDYYRQQRCQYQRQHTQRRVATETPEEGGEGRVHGLHQHTETAEGRLHGLHQHTETAEEGEGRLHATSAY